MGNIKKMGGFLGKALGTVTGEPIKFIGKKFENEYIQEIGEGVKQASNSTGHLAGSLAEGAWNTSSGLINKDEAKHEEGLRELKGTATQTAKGIGNTIKQTAVNGKDVLEGAALQDKNQVMKGLKGIGKTIAVTTIAVGIADGLDIIGDDGAQAATIETRNDGLAGETHLETGVPFEAEAVTLPNGDVVEGVFPQFDSTYNFQLEPSLYLESDNAQFTAANMALNEQVSADSSLAQQFTGDQLAQIRMGETPDGYTWHHAQHPGELQLVDEQIHADTGHTGGRELWGGGSEYR